MLPCRRNGCRICQNVYRICARRRYGRRCCPDGKLGCSRIRNQSGRRDSVRTVSGFFPYTTTVGDITLLRKSGEGKIAVSAGGITDYEEGKQVLAAGAANLGTTCGEALVRAAVAEAETQGLYKDWDETNPFEKMTPEELFRYLQEKQQRE